MFRFEWPKNPTVEPVASLASDRLTLVAVGLDQGTLVAPPLWQKSLEGSSQLQLLQKMGEFKASLGSICLLALSKDSSIVLVGLGELASLSPSGLRQAFCLAGRYLLKLGEGCVQLDFSSPLAALSPQQTLACALEGVLLAQDPVTTKRARAWNSVAWERRLGELPKGVCEGAHSVLLARRMVNANADEMTPDRLAGLAQESVDRLQGIYGAKGCSCEILDEQQLRQMGFGLLSAVGQGAQHPPRLVVLRYEPESNSSAPLLLVGKGISYDTGGLKLKTPEGMLDMRSDMAGAASALAAFYAHVASGSYKALIAVLACAENAIGSKVFKLGDTIVSYAKKSVEITNTDAEGRLVLADALSYAIERFKPRKVVDVATLTGAAVVAVGAECACLMSPDDALADELLSSSERTGERLWRLPLYEEYVEGLKSDMADIKNSGPRPGAASIAAAFIWQFVPRDLPWAHLDIAPVAFLDKEKGLYSKLATGACIRLLIDWIQRA